MKRLVFLAMLCACAGANANLKAAKESGTFGEWRVLQSIDKMTDAVSCTGIYKNDYGVQLSERALYFKMTGGIETVTLRFGNDPARPMRLAEKIEKDVRAVVLEGEEFRSAVHSDRLRIQVLTLVSGVKEFDIDSSGLVDAVEHIKSGCPIKAIAGTSQVTPANKKPEQGVETPKSLCSADVVMRMQEQKIPAVKIKTICAP